MKKATPSIVAVLILLISFPVYGNIFKTFPTFTPYINMGCGNTAIINSPVSFYYNPAFAATYKGYRSTISHLGISISNDYIDLYESISSTNAENISPSYIINSVFSKYFSQSGNFLTGYTGKNVAIYYSHYTFLSIKPDLSITYIPIGEITLYSDNIITVAYSDKLLLNNKIPFIWGISFEYNDRGVVPFRLVPTDMADFTPEAVSQYSGKRISSDIGFLIKTDHIYIGSSIKGVFSSGWCYEDINNDSFFTVKTDPKININGGIINKVYEIAFLYEDASNTENTHYIQHIHLGLNLFPDKFISLYTGINDGYPSWGIRISVWNTEITYMSIEEELSSFFDLKSTRYHSLYIEIYDRQK